MRRVGRRCRCRSSAICDGAVRARRLVRRVVQRRQAVPGRAVVRVEREGRQRVLTASVSTSPPLPPGRPPAGRARDATRGRAPAFRPRWRRRSRRRTPGRRWSACGGRRRAVEEGGVAESVAVAVLDGRARVAAVRRAGAESVAVVVGAGERVGGVGDHADHGCAGDRAGQRRRARVAVGTSEPPGGRGGRRHGSRRDGPAARRRRPRRRAAAAAGRRRSSGLLECGAQDGAEGGGAAGGVALHGAAADPEASAISRLGEVEVVAQGEHLALAARAARAARRAPCRAARRRRRVVGAGASVRRRPARSACAPDHREVPQAPSGTG